MANKFERQRSTRWVKADVPTYGDEWGTEYDEYNEYDEYDENDENKNDHDHEPEIQWVSEESEECSLDTPQIPTQVPSQVPPDSKAKSSSSLVSGNAPEALVSNSTLVLSVDKSGFSSKMTDDEVSSDENSDSETDAISDRKHSPNPGSRSQEYSSQEKESDSFLEREIKGMSNKDSHNFSIIMPPTPTYQTGPRFSLSPGNSETDAYDRNYLSDADSIQREPEQLNVRAPSKLKLSSPSSPAHADEREIHQKEINQKEIDAINSIDSVSIHSTDKRSHTQVEQSSTDGIPGNLSPTSLSSGDRSFTEPMPKTHTNQMLPETLVLSIDRMNMDTSDDSSFYEQDSPLVIENGHADKVVDSKILDTGSSVYQEADNDDWGYKSERSSGFDTQIESLHRSESQPCVSATEVFPPHRVKTDALDSLINDLSKIEGNNSLFDDFIASEKPQPQTDSGNSDYHTPRDAKGLLPTLDSIRDFKLPDFENHLFKDSDIGNLKPHIAPENVHENFVSRVRRDSIRKPPAALINVEGDNEQPQLTNVGKAESISELQSHTETSQPSSRKVSHSSIHSGSGEPAIFAKKFSGLPQTPMFKDLSGVIRRESTMSTNTFNMGAWKPNTSMHRDQFVNCNDTESQMNVSIFNKDDTTYKQFTRMGPVSNYAPSISNSSCISVPDTVDTTLQQIDEDESDGDYPDTISVAKSYCPSPNLGSSLLLGHAHDGNRFKEEDAFTRHSTDDLAAITEEAESNSIHSDSATSKDLRSVSGSNFSKPKSKYPVSNWKNIMAMSQPIDRIELLKKARKDEFEYDTGLSQWLRDSLKSTESPHIQIGQLATQAYKNAQHSDIRRHTSIRSKVSSVRDKMETGNLGMQATSLGRKFFNKGKKLMKQGSD